MTPEMDLRRGHLSFLMRPDQAMQFIAVRDIARIGTAVFGTPESYAGRTMEIAGDALTGNTPAGHLTQATGRPVSYSRLPTTVPAQDQVLTKLEALIDDGDGRLVGNTNLDALRTEFPFLLRFDSWLAGPGAGPLAERSIPRTRASLRSDRSPDDSLVHTIPPASSANPGCDLRPIRCVQPGRRPGPASPSEGTTRYPGFMPLAAGLTSHTDARPAHTGSCEQPLPGVQPGSTGGK